MADLDFDRLQALLDDVPASVPYVRLLKADAGALVALARQADQLAAARDAAIRCMQDALEDCAEARAERDALAAKMAELEAWKNEALAVLSRWDAVAAKVDMPLGALKSREVGKAIDSLRAEVVSLHTQLDTIRALCQPDSGRRWVPAEAQLAVDVLAIIDGRAGTGGATDE